VRSLKARATSITLASVEACARETRFLYEALVSGPPGTLLQRVETCAYVLKDEVLPNVPQTPTDGFAAIADSAFASSVEEQATGGRPKLQLRLDIEQYLNDGYTEIEIARLCGVSRYTVRRRMRERGIQRFSAIGDNPLSTTVQHIADEGNGQWGVGMTDGKLRSLRIRVPRSKLRSLLKNLDPQAHAARSFLARHRITRVRPYSVRGPGALWHFDANLKLRRYKFAIHGCVDGFSRKIMYMHVADNMRAQTVFDLFHDACMRHNYIPSRARCDQGRENVVVADFMLRQRGLHRGSILVGPSVHNQRIERMWLDVRTRFISKVVDVFGRFEDDGMLNVEDDVCMHTLHLVVGPHLRSMLADFVTAWNCHRMRTPTGMSTPNKLHGRLTHAVATSDDEVYAENPDNYGVEQGSFEQDILEDEWQAIRDPLQGTQFLLRRAERLSDLMQEHNPSCLADFMEVYALMLVFVRNCIGTGEATM
jgi:hypothetical protein